MKPIAAVLIYLFAHVHMQAQLPPQLWSIAQDTLTDNLYHYHKNLAISNSGLSAALSNRNNIDHLDVYEADGSLRYSKSFADDQCWYYQVVFSASDELYLMGTNQPQSMQGSSLRVQKLDTNGDVLWTTHWSENATEYTGVIRSHLLSDGRIVVCGQFNFYAPGSSNDFYIVCLTDAGAIDWTYAYTSDGAITDILRNSALDASDQIYFTGIRQNPDLTSYYNLIAGKLDSSGNLLWTSDLDYTNFNGQSVDAASIAIDANGMVLLAANTFTYNDANLPISLPLVLRLEGNDGSTAAVHFIPFEQSAVIKELTTDNDGNYYANFTASRDSMQFITPEFYQLVTYEASHHVKKWNADDQLLWSYQEIASAQTTYIETYDMALYNNQLLVFNYFENNNRILCLSAEGSSTGIYTYPRPVTHIGVYQHHILANNHGVYLYCGSTQPSAQFRPYYVLVRFGADPNLVATSATMPYTVYPNPAHDFVMIEGLPYDAQVHLYDASGRCIPLARMDRMFQWSHVAEGLYVLDIAVHGEHMRHRVVVH